MEEGLILKCIRRGSNGNQSWLRQCINAILKAGTPFIQWWAEGYHSGGYEGFIFWRITPRSLIKVNQLFAGTFRFHSQCRRQKTKNHYEAEQTICGKAHVCILLPSLRPIDLHFSACGLFRLFPSSCWCLVFRLQHWGWGRYVSPKHRLTSTGFRGAISQKHINFQFI
jgi:hypothetical protein